MIKLGLGKRTALKIALLKMLLNFYFYFFGRDAGSLVL
jgi:hypothetical protein